VMHYVFHMLRFIKVIYNINIVNKKSHPFSFFFKNGDGEFFCLIFLKQYPYA
jgi:hypothetical protein